ncbi:MAG: tetraacyldisaccharide 4'-kinase [Planctomycetaceae bacterium]|nr:tetraacyldisaccharide 4'-kinase [Planctomycetaceae bacterium]
MALDTGLRRCDVSGALCARRGYNPAVDTKRYHDIISGRAAGFGASGWRVFLWLMSLLYGVVIRLRLLFYAIGILRKRKAPIPVVCVGNVSAGGTGKTPFVALVCERLISMGMKPAIVSRGYRSLEFGANDEAKVLAELLPEVLHIQNPNRFEAVREVARRGANIAVLDDGFAHLRLKRDLDVLLFDGLRPFGYDALLPLGLLREPLRGAKRAQLAVITRADISTPDIIRYTVGRLERLGFSGERVLYAEHAAQTLSRIDVSAETLPLDYLRGVQVALLCAIGNARGFAGTVEKAGAKIVEETNLTDHFAYDDDWLKHHWPAIAKSAIERGALYIVVTQKDAVKLRGRLSGSPIPVLELGVRMVVRGGNWALDAALERVTGKSPT